MAIDFNHISQLIAEFRILQTKDAVTPESLGYILQLIVDCYAEVCQEDEDKYKSILTSLSSFESKLTDFNSRFAGYDSQINELKSALEADINNLSALTKSIGKPDGIAPLDSDRKIPSRYLPHDVYEVLEFSTIVSDTESSIKVIEGSPVIVPGRELSSEIVWLDRGETAGRFALRVNPFNLQPFTMESQSEEQQTHDILDTGTELIRYEYYSLWENRQRWCDADGLPLRDKLYRCLADNSLYGASVSGRIIKKLSSASADNSTDKPETGSCDCEGITNPEIDQIMGQQTDVPDEWQPSPEQRIEESEIDELIERAISND